MSIKVRVSTTSKSVVRDEEVQHRVHVLCSRCVCVWVRCGAQQWGVLDGGGTVTVQGEAITKDDVLVARTAKGEVVVESSGDLTVALDTHVTDGLRREGLMRELVSRVQKLRKDQGLEVADRISLTLATQDADLKACFTEHEARIKDEVLATSLVVSASGEGDAMDLDGHVVTVRVVKV